MAFNAKPSGAYGFSSAEGTNNVQQMYNMFSSLGYAVEAIAGVIGNSMSESGLNPWRWQGDKVSMRGGYGLFQYTPASDYINLTGIQYFAPNLSTTEVTSGADPNDGFAQIIVFDENRLSKWGSGAWRPYWSTTTYAQLYAERNRILKQWGSGSSISMAQFKAITNVYDATFVFLACFEGPLVPNMTPRYNNASTAYEILTGMQPEPPTPTPTPTPKQRKGMPLWMYLRPMI